MNRAKPITEGTWTKIASKHYRHIDGIEVKYNHNRWVWVIVGGRNDGQAYGTLSVAQYVATERQS